MLRHFKDKLHKLSSLYTNYIYIDVIITILMVVSGISVLSILINGNFALDLSYKGFSNAIHIFKFPFSMLAAALALATIRLTLANFQKMSEYVNVINYQLLVEQFKWYTDKKSSFPITVIKNTLQNKYILGTYDLQWFPRCIYPNPIITLQRVYEKDGSTINEDVITSISNINSLYENMINNIGDNYRGDNINWLKYLVELSVCVRNLREYLILWNNIMHKWTTSYKLKGDLGSLMVPPIKDFYFDSLRQAIFLDILCICDVLIFVRCDENVKNLFKIAGDINMIKGKFDKRINGKLDNKNLDRIWRDNYL